MLLSHLFRFCVCVCECARVRVCVHGVRQTETLAEWASLVDQHSLGIVSSLYSSRKVSPHHHSHWPLLHCKQNPDLRASQASLELTILLPQPLECWYYGMHHTKSFVSSPWVTFNISGEWEGLITTRKGSVPGDTNPANCLLLPSTHPG